MSTTAEKKAFVAGIEKAAQELQELSPDAIEHRIEDDLSELFPDLYRTQAGCPAQDVHSVNKCRYAIATKDQTLSAVLIHLNDEHKTWTLAKIATWAKKQCEGFGKALAAAEGNVWQEKSLYVKPRGYGKPDADALGAAWLACRAAGMC